jgi:hypothetical protein
MMGTEEISAQHELDQKLKFKSLISLQDSVALKELGEYRIRVVYFMTSQHVALCDSSDCVN